MKEIAKIIENTVRASDLLCLRAAAARPSVLTVSVYATLCASVVNKISQGVHPPLRIHTVSILLPK